MVISREGGTFNTRVTRQGFRDGIVAMTNLPVNASCNKQRAFQ